MQAEADHDAALDHRERVTPADSARALDEACERHLRQLAEQRGTERPPMLPDGFRGGFPSDHLVEAWYARADRDREEGRG